MMEDLLRTYWPYAIGALLVLALALVLLRRRRTHVSIGSVDPVVAPTLARVATADPTVIDVPLPALVADAGAADNLRLIKGLGPKVAARLNEVGIVRFEQLAALDSDARATLDAQLGTFAGRMGRDRWVEQAALLARGDVAAFEAQFGKLG